MMFNNQRKGFMMVYDQVTMMTSAQKQEQLVINNNVLNPMIDDFVVITIMFLFLIQCLTSTNWLMINVDSFFPQSPVIMDQRSWSWPMANNDQNWKVPKC